MKTALVLCVLGLGLVGASLVDGTVVLDEAEAASVAGGFCLEYPGYVCVEGPGDCNSWNAYYYPCEGTGQCIQCEEGTTPTDHRNVGSPSDECYIQDTKDCGLQQSGLCVGGECDDYITSNDPCDDTLQCTGLTSCP